MASVHSTGSDGKRNRRASFIDFASKIFYLPVNKSVSLDILSRDVIHSFWVPEFLYRRTAIPEHTPTTCTSLTTKDRKVHGKCRLCGATTLTHALLRRCRFAGGLRRLYSEPH
ncbi:MAG: hypothetical protein KIT06_00160 [Cryobacterium sp.]|nr:hypothetical protein [Cryobacterium sp.]